MDPTPERPEPGPGHDLGFAQFADHFEVSFGDRIAIDHPELVDQCADWLEDQIGVVNLGQIDHRTPMADGPLTSELRSGIRSWWEARVEGLDPGA